MHMEDIHLERISRALSQKLNEEVALVSIEKIGRGYHAEGFKATARDGRDFFIKRISSVVQGFEYPERKVASLMVGHGMAKRANRRPLPVGVFTETNGVLEAIPDISQNTVVYHVQEFEPEGKAYAELLGERESKTKIDEQDRLEIENITDHIVQVHQIRHPSSDSAELCQVYNDGLRAEMVHPEVTMPFLHEFESDHPLIPPERQGEYLTLLLQMIHTWKNRSDRLCALHGDFWGGNVFLRQDSSVWVIDYSRIPWGDPGVDVGKWMSYYLWYFYKTGNSYYRDLGDLFLETYIQKTGDEEVRQSMCLGFAFAGVLYSMLDFFPEVDIDVRKKMFTQVCSIIKNNRFSWGV